MTDEVWRPLGIDTDDQIAEYDALHDGVPTWMSSALWAWIKEALTEYHRYRDGSGFYPMLDEDLFEELCQALRIEAPVLRARRGGSYAGDDLTAAALQWLGSKSAQGKALQIVDYILAFGTGTKPEVLEALLSRAKSVWAVGERAGKAGLVRRVPLGVQVGADLVMDRAGKAGVRLAEAWENLYRPEPNASQAYRAAILAVEDAAIPVVSPKNKAATLGTVISQVRDQGDWGLPMARESRQAPSHEVLLGMMRMLWQGQHDRHGGGEPTAPGNVSFDEAVVAVGTATTLVHWFSAGMVRRDPSLQS